MLETVLEPVIFGFKANQHARRLAVTRYHDLLRFRFPEKAGQIVLDLRQRHLLHSGSANCASHFSTSDLATIARTSTVAPEYHRTPEHRLRAVDTADAVFLANA